MSNQKKQSKKDALNQAIKDHGVNYMSKGHVVDKGDKWVYELFTQAELDMIVANNKKAKDAPKRPGSPRANGTPIPLLAKSTVESPCLKVWETADEMIGATRKDVIIKCVEEGVATATAKTQYQRWFVAKKADEAKQGE